MSKSEDVDQLTGSLRMLTIQQEKARHNENVPINRLPAELFCIILEDVVERRDLDQLLAYESVCQQWSYYVKAFVRQKLVISRRTKQWPCHWFYLDESCPPERVAVRAHLNIRPMENSFLFSLKHLKICDPTTKGSSQKEWKPLLPNMHLINRMKALEVLELSQLPLTSHMFDREKKLTISLPNLKHLAIYHVLYQNLLLDCPQLVSYKTKEIFGEYNRLEFSSPASISHLYLEKFSNLSNFMQLVGLQYLSLTGFENDDYRKKYYPSQIFSTFPNLKHISFRPNLLCKKNPCNCLDSRDDFLKLLKMKQALRRDEVMLTFCGIHVESEYQLQYENELKIPFCDVLVQLYMQNYSTLYDAELRWTKRLDYIGTPFEIPADFYEKFKHVRELQVKRQGPDEDQLISFIETFERLELLVIRKEAQLRESFYKKLARSCSSFAYLGIWIETLPYRQTSFDFLFEFQQLVRLTIRDCRICEQIIRRLFDHFEAFEFNFWTDKEEIRITRSGKDAPFELRHGSYYSKTIYDLDELLEDIDSDCKSGACMFDDCPVESSGSEIDSDEYYYHYFNNL